MADNEHLYLFLVGTAGSGKTRLTAAMQRWAIEHHLDAITVNLDPGAERLPYEPDVDIREWIRLADIMDEHGLGPNGAQVVAADLLALRAEEVLEEIEGFRTDYVLLDTPGQTELFVFREAGRHMVERLAPGRTALCFLVDPFLARDPSAFVSQMMLAATTQFRFQVPMLNVLTKADMLDEAEVDRILGWMDRTETLGEALEAGEKSMFTEVSRTLLQVLEDLGTYTRLTPVSSETFDGIEDVYAFLQGAFSGGEDPERR